MMFLQRETTSVTEPVTPAPASASEADAKSQSDEDREQKQPCYTVTVPLKLKKRHHSLLQQIPLVEVPAAGTSQNCPQCGRWWAFDPKLSERWRDCGCGWSASRDVTSAYEVLRRATPEFRKRGGGAPWGRNVSTVGRVVQETPVRRKRPGAGARRRKAAAESGQLDLPI